MNQANVMKIVAVFSILCVLFMAVSCATGGGQMMTPEQQEASLRIAAEQYWNARIEGKYEITYALEDTTALPADFTEYKLIVSSIMKLNPQSVSIGAITLDDQHGTVTVKFMIKMPDIPKPSLKLIRDAWVHQEGKWLHRLSP